MTLLRTPTALTLAGLAVASSSAAVAQSGIRGSAALEAGGRGGLEETRSEAVRTSDLDLSTPSGAAVMLRRINHAAKDVCSPEPVRISNLEDSADYQRCMRGATNRAVGTLNTPAVTYAYTRRHEPR